MVAQNLLQLIAIGAIAGAFGQGLRVIVGVKKASDEASSEGKSLREEGLDTSRMMLSLFIGATAGGIGIFTITGFSDEVINNITLQIFFGVVGIGYAGTDFIEGFIRTQLPMVSEGYSARLSSVRSLQAPGAIPITASTKDTIKQSCDRLLKIPRHAADCSGFVKAVCSEFGVTLTGQANNIVDQLSAATGWTELGSDAQAGQRAAEAAMRGELVIGGRKEAGNGHVVVVEGSPLDHSKYPFAYWGKLNDPVNAGFNKTVNWAWDSESRDSVTYASRRV